MQALITQLSTHTMILHAPCDILSMRTRGAERNDIMQEAVDPAMTDGVSGRSHIRIDHTWPLAPRECHAGLAWMVSPLAMLVRGAARWPRGQHERSSPAALEDDCVVGLTPDFQLNTRTSRAVTGQAMATRRK